MCDVARPRIVCLCGSVRFMDYFIKANEEETLAGKIVLSVGLSLKEKEAKGIIFPPEVKVALDELHKRKIDLSDEVLILNVGGYIGDSTKSEIEYARTHGKVIRFLEEV